MEAAESLILSLKSLQEEFSHSAKSQLIENSGETTMGADSEPQKSVEVATRADFKNKQSTSSGAKNVEDLEDCKMPDASLGIQSDHVPDPMAREVSWELHPQCSQGCNHARLWDNEATKEDFSCEMMAGIESCAMSGRTPLENNIESLNCGVVCLDEKSKISLPEPLALRATQAAKSEDMSHTAAEKKHNDYHGEDDQKVPSREEAESAENSSAQEKGREEMALSTADGSSEDSSTEQGPADKLAMSFLEAAHNLIGELIPGKEEAGLSSVRRVVVILTDSENGDLIMGQGEELSDASGSISSVEPPIENTDDAEQVRCHSQGCDGTGTSQCQKIAEKEDQLNKLTSEKLVCSDDCGATNESHPKVLSNIEGVKEGNFLPTDEKIGANDMQDMEATMGDEIQKIKNEDKNKRGDDKNTISPRQKSNSGNITINVSTGERGDGLTQHEAGIDKTGVTDRGEEGAAKEHYKELVQDDETEVTTDRSQSVHSEDIEQMNNEACLCPGPDSMTHEEKADETSDRINLSQSETCSYEGPAGTVVKSVLLSTQDLIGSLTSLKEKLGKNDKMMRSVKTDSHILHSAEDCPNMHSNIHEESFSQSCDSLNGKGIIESTPNMVLGLSHVGAISEDRRVQPEENASARSEKGNHNMQQNDKASPIIADSSILQEHEQNLPIDNKDEEWVLGETGLAEKECLKHSTFRKGEAEGMVLENQGHIDWKKKWRSACEQQMDKLRKYDDDSKLESSISKRIKLQIIEKSKNESVSYKQKPRPPSLTAVPTESEMQEEVNQTSFRCEDEGNGEHTDDIQGNEGDLVTQSKNTGTEQTYSDTTMCGNNNEQGSLKDLTMSLLEATNCLIGRLASLKGELGRSQVSDSSVSCKEIEQNVQDIQEQESDVEVTDEAPTSLMMETEDSNSSSDIIRNRTTMDISTKKAENCQAMNNYPIQETSADEESRGVIQRQQARCEEKVESSEMVVSITSNLAIIQNNRNQGEHCHMLKGTQLEISTRSVETFHQIGNTDDTQMQFNNKTKISQEERSPNVQLTKHQEKDVPLTSESIEQAIPKEALSDTSYSLKVSHTQLTNDPLAKWKSIVMRKIKVSSEHNIYGMHNIKLGSVKSELVTSENSNGDMNVDTLKPTENEINEKIDTEPDDEKVEQMGDPQMKDLEEMQTLRSYIRDGVIKKREGEREEEKQNKETKNQSNEINPDQLNSQGSATSDLYHGKGLEGTDLHRLVSFDDRVLENKESLVKVNVKYTSYETDAMLKRSVTQETLIDHEIYAKEINAQEKFDDKTDTEQPMKLSRAVGPYLANFQKAERQSMAIIKQKPSPWLKFWEAANQTVAVAAVSTTQSSNFFGHLAQVPANGVLVRNEKQLSCPLPTFSDAQVKSPTLSEPSHGTKKKDRAVSSPTPQTCSLPPSEAALQREKVFIRLSLREQEEAMQRLTDLQRQAELKCTNDRSRQMLRFQERLSIAQNRKSELDLMEITQRISPQLSPETLPEGDLERQKSAVKEHLERVKRERTYIMQTKRDRNMSGFRELLDPVLSGQKREDSGSELKGVEGPSGTGQA
ncbi:centromere-associated protein E-like [Eleutherodactylus coqui]|uniref:centromere-associated protein E-like n=1 Tax=Eleutherodactylus coqui TaxID=57060 RepID=UPI003461D401